MMNLYEGIIHPIDAHDRQRFIESHGFDAFTNPDNSVSFWLPGVRADGTRAETLITVRSDSETRAALGY